MNSEWTGEFTSPEINLDRNDIVSITDLVESTDVVQLETSDDCLISNVSKALFYDDRYYILDKNQLIVFCFDSQGKFLFKINRRGHGPEEYSALEDIEIDIYNKQLLLLEPFGRLFIFDKKGHFVSRVRLPGQIPAYNEIHSLDKDRLLFVSITHNQLGYYSRLENKIIHIHDLGNEDVKPTFRLAKIDNRIYAYKGQLFYTNALSNRIENLSDSTVYHWNFEKKNNTKKQIDKLLKEYKIVENQPFDQNETAKEFFADYVSQKKLNCEIILCYETSRYKICFVHRGKFRNSHIFIDKQTGEYYVFDKTKEGIDFRLHPMSYGESLIQNNTKDFTYYFNPGYNYESHLNMKCFDKNLLSEEQRAIIESHGEDDNPFLIKYNFNRLIHK
jgi:hypothetical protein